MLCVAFGAPGNSTDNQVALSVVFINSGFNYVRSILCGPERKCKRLFLEAHKVLSEHWKGTNSFIQAISIAPLQVHYNSEALPTQHGYYVRVLRRSATGNCEQRTCPRSLRGG